MTYKSWWFLHVFCLWSVIRISNAFVLWLVELLDRCPVLRKKEQTPDFLWNGRNLTLPDLCTPVFRIQYDTGDLWIRVWVSKVYIAVSFACVLPRVERSVESPLSWGAVVIGSLHWPETAPPVRTVRPPSTVSTEVWDIPCVLQPSLFKKQMLS